MVEDLEVDVLALEPRERPDRIPPLWLGALAVLALSLAGFLLSLESGLVGDYFPVYTDLDGPPLFREVGEPRLQGPAPLAGYLAVPQNREAYRKGQALVSKNVWICPGRIFG